MSHEPKPLRPLGITTDYPCGCRATHYRSAVGHQLVLCFESRGCSVIDLASDTITGTEIADHIRALRTTTERTTR